MATEQEERELKRIGRVVARAIEPRNDRAIAAARRKLFEPKEEKGGASRWVFGLAAVSAVAAVTFAIRSSDGPAAAPGAAARGAAEQGASRSTGKDGVRAADNAQSHVTTRADGVKELVLEQGEARGPLGEGSDVTSVAAGPYRISGNARVVVTWSDMAGLQLDVSDGEARVLAPGMTPVVVAAGASKKLPAKP